MRETHKKLLSFLIKPAYLLHGITYISKIAVRYKKYLTESF